MKFKEMTDRLVNATHITKKKIINNFNKLLMRYEQGHEALIESRISKTNSILVQFNQVGEKNKILWISQIHVWIFLNSTARRRVRQLQTRCQYFATSSNVSPLCFLLLFSYTSLVPPPNTLARSKIIPSYVILRLWYSRCSRIWSLMNLYYRRFFSTILRSKTLFLRLSYVFNQPHSLTRPLIFVKYLHSLSPRECRCEGTNAFVIRPQFFFISYYV